MAFIAISALVWSKENQNDMQYLCTFQLVKKKSFVDVEKKIKFLGFKYKNLLPKVF